MRPSWRQWIGSTRPATGGHRHCGRELGWVVNAGAAVERNRRSFADRRRNLQRKGTRSAKRKLRTIKRTQARYQTDTNHVISKRVVAMSKDTGRGIAVEDL